MIYYSAEKNCFYLSNIHRNIPDNVVEVTKSVHNECMDAPSNGMIVIPGEDGYPKIVPQEISDDQHNLIVQAELEENDRKSARAVREFLLAKFGDDPLLPTNADGENVLKICDDFAAEKRAEFK